MNDNTLIEIKQRLVRGDTPLLRFHLKMNGVAIDISEYSAEITITKTPNPTTLDDALIAKQPASVDGPEGIITYQLKSTETKDLLPNVWYYGDVQLTKEPVNTNTFTPIRFKFMAVVDYGI